MTLVMVYEGGKWYVKALEAGLTRAGDGSQPFYHPGDTSSRATLSPVGPDLGEVVYGGLEPGKFMRKCLCRAAAHPVGGPGLFPGCRVQRKAFDADLPDLASWSGPSKSATPTIPGCSFRRTTVSST